MNKEQQELRTGLPPLTETAERNIDHDDFYFAFCQRNTELIASLSRERELQADRDECIEKNRQLVLNNEKLGALVEKACTLGESHEKRAEAAESQLLAKDALVASLKSEISKQNKAEDELLATGEKLAEERA